MKKWLVAEKYPENFGNQFPEVPGVALQLLYNRGLKSMEEIDEFLYPDWTKDIYDPFLFRNMRVSVDRLYGAIQNGETIAIFADYDADGICAGACLYVTLRALGAKLLVYLPHRETEGYGLSEGAVKHLGGEGAKIIITCDCGISNKNEISLAKDLGIDVIVTDHHGEPPELPDKAFALVHPKLQGETYPYKNLSGGGVAFKLAQGLLRDERSRGKIDNHEAFEKWLLDLVAISTVADMVPLVGESRTLVKHGLMVLNKNRRLGLKKLFLTAGIKEGNVDTRTIGFQIAPRINAASRMNHANTSFKLLVSENEDEAVSLSAELNNNNIARGKLTAQILAEARGQIMESNQGDEPVLIAQKKEWPLSLAGLVAGKISEEYYRPVLVLGDKGGKPAGSGRSIPDFNLIKALQDFRDYFENYGGHPAAGGFTFKSYDNLEEFSRKFRDYARAKLEGVELVRKLKIDAKISLKDIGWELYDLLSRFEPFGQENPVPRYLAENVIVERVDALGDEGKHLKILVSQNGAKAKMIGFCFGEPEKNDGVNWCQLLKIGDRLDVVFEIGVNEWNGNRELQLKLVDLRLVNSDVVV